MNFVDKMYLIKVGLTFLICRVIILVEVGDLNKHTHVRQWITLHL